MASTNSFHAMTQHLLPIASNNHGSDNWENFHHIKSFMTLKLQKKKKTQKGSGKREVIPDDRHTSS